MDRHYSFFASQKLYASVLVNVSDEGTFNPSKPLVEDRGRILLILNWISFCLVPDDADQSIAAALALNTSSSGLDIVLSTNVFVTQTQEEYAEHFMKVLNNLMRNPQSPQHGVRDILTLVARYAWKRVHRKASLVINAGTLFSEAQETTLETLTRLVALNPNETDILTSFNHIVSLTLSLLNDDLEERLKTLEALMDHAATILASPLLRVDQERSFEDELFVRHLYRRVQRLHFYQYGIEALLDPKRRMLRREWQFQPRWLSYVPPTVLRLPRSSIDHVRDVLTSFGYKPTREDIKEMFGYFRRNGEVWNAGDVQTLYMHPEARLAEYLKSNDVPLLSRTIGCSKRACAACALCVFPNSNDPQEEDFVITVPTQKIRASWMCPNLNDSTFTAGMDKFNEEMNSEHIKAIYERQLVLLGRK